MASRGPRHGTRTPTKDARRPGCASRPCRQSRARKPRPKLCTGRGRLSGPVRTTKESIKEPSPHSYQLSATRQSSSAIPQDPSDHPTSAQMPIPPGDCHPRARARGRAISPGRRATGLLPARRCRSRPRSPPNQPPTGPARPTARCRPRPHRLPPHRCRACGPVAAGRQQGGGGGGTGRGFCWPPATWPGEEGKVIGPEQGRSRAGAGPEQGRSRAGAETTGPRQRRRWARRRSRFWTGTGHDESSSTLKMGPSTARAESTGWAERGGKASQGRGRGCGMHKGRETERGRHRRI